MSAAWGVGTRPTRPDVWGSQPYEPSSAAAGLQPAIYGNGPDDAQHPHNGTAYELTAEHNPLHQTTAAITHALRCGGWERLSPACSLEKKFPSLEMTKTRPDVKLRRLVQGHKVRRATVESESPPVWRLALAEVSLLLRDESGTDVPLCSSILIRGSETRRRWQGSGHRPARSKFVLGLARLLTMSRIGRIHKTWPAEWVSSLTYRTTHRAWSTCSLAAPTQPPRELYSALFLPDGGDEQAKSLRFPSLVICSPHRSICQRDGCPTLA